MSNETLLLGSGRQFSQVTPAGLLRLYFPVPLGICVGLFSLLNGASISYFFLQLALFLLLVPLLWIVRYVERYASIVLLATFLKIFYVSQIICIFLGRSPEDGLSSPIGTLMAILLALVAGIVGILLAWQTSAFSPMRAPVLTTAVSAPALDRLGVLSALIGVPAQIGWSYVSSHLSASQLSGVGHAASGLVVLSFLDPLLILSICCFAAEKLVRSGGQTFISRRFLVVSAIYLAITLPLAGKAEILNPIVAIFLTAVLFRWRFRLAPILVGLSIVVLVSEFIYPIVTFSRLQAFGQERSVPMVFLEEVGKCLTDVDEFKHVQAYSSNYSRTIGQSYFGRPVGFFDRFTPLTTDRLIVGANYVNGPGAWTVLSQTALSILPQTFGYQRDTTGPQKRVEAATTRTLDARGRVGWANSGYIGDGYISGGPLLAMTCMLIFGYISSVAGRMTFGAIRQNVFIVPYIIQFMFIPADQTFGGSAPSYFWGWMFLTGAILFIIKVLGAGSAPVRAVADRSSFTT